MHCFYKKLFSAEFLSIFNLSDMDCRIFPDSCDVNAICKNSTSNVPSNMPDYYSCQCASGYIGNGFMCAPTPNCVDVCCNKMGKKFLAIEEEYCNCSTMKCPTTTLGTTSKQIKKAYCKYQFKGSMQKVLIFGIELFAWNSSPDVGQRTEE